MFVFFAGDHSGAPAVADPGERSLVSSPCALPCISTLALGAVLMALGEIKQSLAAMSINHIPGDMSKASLTQQQYALRNRRLKLRVVRVTELLGFKEIAVPPFDKWGCLSEDAATPLLLTHFEDNFSLPPNTHVEDVHNADALLSADVQSSDVQGRSVVTHFRGKTDFIVVDSLHVVRGDPESAATGALCLVEIKRATVLRDKRAACRAQAILELLAIEEFCGYAVPVVLTNLEEPSSEQKGPGIHIFSRKGGILREFVGPQGKPLTLAEANGVLALLLPEVLKERARTDAALLERIPDDEDDESSDDDEAGAEEESGAEDDGVEEEGVAPVRGVATAARRGNNRKGFQGRRTGGGAESSESVLGLCGAPTLLPDDARLFAAVSIENHARRLRTLVGQSPQILQVLRHLSANVDES